ncbi:UDP-N-acetylmuramoyl-L-alanyl-D-glutamate--2,6-diaminopimelate ligase [Moritella viscosa]|uniref:UDP-N-acetylmuramoyl-L-alanyl-D-glutamate--2,6-diaminopimelate ligase n=2 Tax=Moritella viscosa TaxID=80854 RepID=A0A1K9ZUQ1_9GAMM|nr:UDP-N-acetylmuramoyl-L-alanyl-D-glutamate--2,6-diaminopimelate ligase [Moritella viscosa]SGY92131.1 MurE [Moritella viscosa]SGY96517.1 MurE [Moritella viscosa]SGY96977.1 MurE [Moritella viscosa]SGZ02154.1 MurE [Moritella viscosa]SGZ02650.1 MurE [Moritella viscosa]
MPRALNIKGLEMNSSCRVLSLQTWNIDFELAVNALIIDSRKVQAGDCFVAINGHALDGRRFIGNALQCGATVVLKDADIQGEHGHIEYVDGIPIVAFFGLNKALSALADSFYQFPSQQLKLVGVTGTNGKSTITQIIANWVTLLNGKAGVMGTIGNGLFDQLVQTENTTGSGLDVQAEIASQVQQGAELCAMEVSSHGLIQGRVNSLDFDVALFTNLTRDHLDYHGDMDNYADAKKILFQGAVKHRILNVDDTYGKAWSQQWPDAIRFSVQQDLSAYSGAFLYCHDLNFDTGGFNCELKTSWGEGTLRCGLIGEFNASNVVAACASLLALGYDLDDLLQVAPKLTAVCGRMELFKQAGQAACVVDYAHTPDALEKALQALRVHCEGKLWCIYGCGGDRDTGKRPIMAQVAEQFADMAVITDDNPRTESASSIVADMKIGLANPDVMQVIHDRRSAIHWAMEQSRADDIILVAGKGHEDYQIIGVDKHHYSDRETIREMLSKK